MNQSSLNPLDVSDLLFHRADSTHAATTKGKGNDDKTTGVDRGSQWIYIGPIAIRPTTTSKGRCLVATRAIDAGELLFVTPPIVNANVQDVWEEYTQRRIGTHGPSSLAQVAEHVLLNACKAAIAEQNYDVIRCLNALERNKRGIDDDSLSNTCCIGPLLGQKNTADDNKYDNDDEATSAHQLSDDEILQIIRRNAFGSDFPTTNRVEQRWLEVLDDSCSNHNDSNANVNSSVNTNVPKNIFPSRLLGIYGLAAMINHSCIPNAVRVFSSTNDCMVVHTCQPIPSGGEIVWSYIPVIQPYQERQLLLQRTHNFICECPRCLAESMLGSSSSGNDTLPELQLCADHSAATVVHRLENDTLKQSSLSNDSKRYIRMSIMQSYMNYINDTLLLFQAESNTNDVAPLQSLLTLAFQLHLAFVVCHNVSTEHLSVRSCLRVLDWICQLVH